MVHYRVKVNGLNVRTGPSTSYTAVAQYSSGDTLYGDSPFLGSDGKWWVKYIGAQSHEPRYVCYREGSKYYLTIIS